MKIVFIIVATFLIAILTSMLLDLEFNSFRVNPVRYVLIIILIIVELVTGLFYVKDETE